ncbi:MAG: adenylosuccinate synthase [Clostridiales Family XIII bacterium]|jgi:adenylosuccinate synthase|nr:adenylosuccinate synthase [Clostridiales Family XIII bacterium]
MAKTIAVVGSQWGDEGKGKIIDYLAGGADVVVRAQGGSNAGHSVVIDGKRYSLHLIPSGILNPGAENIIGNGVVFDPAGFFEELKSLESDGVNTEKIYVSDRAHVVFPWHKTLDALSEKARGAASIGTTLKGIGPCYMDKVERSGIRVCDLICEEIFREKFEAQLAAKNAIITKLYDGQPLDGASIYREFTEYAKRLAPYVRDTGLLVYDAVTSGKTVLFEGAQGSMLDLDLGTYPYVTSSHPISGGFTSGSGIGAGLIEEIIGITKAYTTRVGEGPFVTELHDETGVLIRERGHEYGVTTGRARRCGWFDGVVVRHSARINGMTGIALMLLDVLDAFDELKLCIAYEHDGEKVEHYPANLKFLSECTPVYRTLKGWKTDLSKLTSYDALPEEAKAYIAAVEEISGVPVKIVSVGPGREQTIIREDVLSSK